MLVINYMQVVVGNIPIGDRKISNSFSDCQTTGDCQQHDTETTPAGDIAPRDFEIRLGQFRFILESHRFKIINPV